LKIKQLFEGDSFFSPGIFLRKPFYFGVTVAVLVTTIFSWFNLNSWCIILFAACGLFNGNPLSNIKSAFSNKYFLGFFAYFLTELLGMLHTHNQHAGWNIVSKEATLVAIPFVLCCRPFADAETYKKLMTSCCLILVAASCWCIILACRNYVVTKDIEVFFYHPLVRPISQNAIFYTVFILFALLFLLSADIGTAMPGTGNPLPRKWRLALICFFCLMVVLLASKLFLITLVLMLLYFLLRKYSFRQNRKRLMAAGGILVLLGVLLVSTNNPIKNRYNDIVEANISMIATEHFNPGVYFNGLQLRLLEWRFAFEILKEQGAWLWGTGTGDSQDLLNQKYIDANMYMGTPGRKGHGFIGYNFHNQFIETLVRSGVIGLAVLLILFGLMFGIARQWKTGQAYFTVLILMIFFLPQSPLTMQHGVFLFCFFPLLLLYSPKNTHSTRASAGTSPGTSAG
jgi:O-antigen ligase